MKTALLTAGLSLLTLASFAAETTPRAPAPATNAPASAPPTGVPTALAAPSLLLNPANQAAVQGRLQPSTEAQMIEKYGVGGYVLKKRSVGSTLQLLNPFAPSSYGHTGPPPTTWNGNPLYAPGSPPPPRAFRDDKTLEPSGVVLGGQF
jgi:hypothetical protein